MNRATIVVVAVLTTLSAAVFAAEAAQGPPDHSTLPAADHARGIVFDGLRPADPSGPCRGLFEMELADGEVLCTHGPDIAPRGIDVRNGRARTFAETDDGAVTAAEGAAYVACIGNGVDGSRVQAIYVVASDQTDRYNEIEPQIHGWAAEVERVFNESAAQVGGERHVRFVTNPDCSLDVGHAVVSAAGDDSITNTINELKALGFNDPSRKYLIWMDAAVYCGIGQLYPDDKPTADNLNNGAQAMFGRIDTGCWGRSSSVEAHELMHTMGGVQPSAPHASAHAHCTDEYDRMCYQDGADVVMTYECPNSNEAYFDCGHDDYYHPAPPAGSYLASHWNVADSSFLHAGPIGDPPPPTNQPPTVDAGADQSVEHPASAQLSGTIADDGLPNGAVTSTWSVVSGPGTVTFANPAAVATTAAFSAHGTYVLRLSGDDGELVSDDTVTVTCNEPANQAPVVSAGPDRAVQLPAAATLAGSVDDDGRPAGELITGWSKLSGPGGVTFGDVSAAATTATFSLAGTYVLELTADDSELTAADTMTVTVTEEAAPEATTDTFEASLNKRRPTRSYVITTSGGEIAASLTAQATGKGKKAKAPPALTLSIFNAANEPIGEATSPAEWSRFDLPAGDYTFVVGGDTRASFVLEITYWP